MADGLLKNSAIAFKNLLEIEYLLKIGRKGKATIFKIVFESNDFKHLTGIGKLYDLTIHKQPANIIFRNALSGEISDKDLIKSSHFREIADRLEHLKNLEYYLDNNMVVFKWDRTTANSTIVADYMLEEKTLKKPKAYVFIKEKLGLSEVRKLKVCDITKEGVVSFFRSDKEFSTNQVKYSLLKNEKVYKSTGVKKVLFDFESIL